MKVFIACERSGVVRDAFSSIGHDATSCDIVQGTFWGKHIQGDVLKHLDKNWDMILAFPPCTYLCRQAARWYENEETRSLVNRAADFFNKIKDAPCKKIVIENPIPHKRAAMLIGQYSQIIQPYQFGHDYSKATCLWVKGVPLLKPTKIVPVTYYTTPKGRRYTKGWYFTPRNSEARSKAFLGIAAAMAAQWGR